MCGVAARLGSSGLTTCKMVTCGIPSPASFNSASVRSEVLQDVVKYSREAGYNVSDWLRRWQAALLRGVAKVEAIWSSIAVLSGTNFWRP